MDIPEFFCIENSFYLHIKAVQYVMCITAQIDNALQDSVDDDTL